MAFDGNGNFTVTAWSPSTEATLSPPDNYVQSDTAQDGLDELATGLSQTFLRDGRASATGNFLMGGFQVKNLQFGSEDGDAVNFSQLTTLDEAKADIDLQNVNSGAYASETNRGVAIIATEAEAIAKTNDTKFMTPFKVGKLLTDNNAYPPKYINGFLPSYVDADNITLGLGNARDNQNSTNINTTIEYTKDKSISWVLGNGGGMAQGTSVGINETFHMFVISGGLASATSGKFSTDDISTNLSNFTAVSDGYLSYRVDGGAIETVENIDFTNVLSISDIAFILDNIIANVEVEELNNAIVFTSLTEGVSSSVEIFESTLTGTDIFGANYLDGINGLATQGADGQAGIIDAGYDTDVSATNLMSDTNVISEGFNKYRRVASFKTDGNGDIRNFNIFESAGGYSLEYVSDLLLSFIGGGAGVYDLGLPEIELEANLYFYQYILAGTVLTSFDGKQLFASGSANGVSNVSTGNYRKKTSTGKFDYSITGSAFTLDLKIYTYGYKDTRR